jgi:hypothetical protein
MVFGQGQRYDCVSHRRKHAPAGYIYPIVRVTSLPLTPYRISSFSSYLLVAVLQLLACPVPEHGLMK